MTKQEQFKPRVPSLRELTKWHNEFGRILKPNQKRTKLFGIDGKEVEFTERSMPQHLHFQNRIRDGERLLDNNLDYSHLIRTDGSRSDFRLDCPDGKWGFLTYAECDLVLGSNYYVIDESYSSPGPRIRKIVFKANEWMAKDYYNSFELGASFNEFEEGITTDIIYYKIPEQRFRELRDWKTSRDSLVNAVKGERK